MKDFLSKKVQTEVCMTLNSNELELLRAMAKEIQADLLAARLSWVTEKEISPCHQIMSKLRQALDPELVETVAVTVNAVVPKKKRNDSN